ncbi:MaoC family dehydratase [Massilia sp. DD77]|uniref:MaoC family dehydratase n=1 Tax=Massilia sp. DD77 TaxID=3109349 RepID=UPI002FFDF31E
MLLRALLKRPSRRAGADIGATYRLPNIDLAHVRRYNAAIGFAGDALPLPFLYLLAQRAQLATMLDRPTPFKIPGLIHVENTLTMHGPIDPARPLAISTEVSMQAPAANGAIHCLLETRAFDGERLAFACSSNYLVRRGSKAEGKSSATATPAGQPLGRWTLARDAGRRYAALSGDWNPIHLWQWSARLMGMRAPIIHGAHSMAKACALLQQASGRTVESVRCRFRSPVALGEELVLIAGGAEGEFAALCKDRVAMEGRAGFA